MTKLILRVKLKKQLWSVYCVWKLKNHLLYPTNKKVVSPQTAWKTETMTDAVGALGRTTQPSGVGEQQLGAQESAQSEQPPANASDEGIFESIADFVKGVSVPNLILAAVVGALGGTALSFVNQTIVSPPKELYLPFDNTDYLQKHARELLHAINEFYTYRRFVDRDDNLQRYDAQAKVLIEQTNQFVATYNQIYGLRKQLGFTEEFLQHYTTLLLQARKHIQVAVQSMRVMSAMLSSGNRIEVEKAFNYLFSLYCDRIYQLNLITDGIRN